MNLNIAFGPEQAANYDSRFANFTPLRDSLFCAMRNLFAELPEDSHILSVGAGTGADLMDLARAFPKFTFTAVEPAKAMLDVCRQKVEAAGITDRCQFHEGYLDSLPRGKPFHGATSILVSQFLVDKKERTKFFAEISSRLVPGGLLVNADLASKIGSPEFEAIFPLWLRVLGGGPEVAQNLKKVWAEIGVLPPAEVEELMREGGFPHPALFHQAIFIHAWAAKIKG